MFIGRYYHHLEVNGRVSLPKPFRLPSQVWILTRGLDGGLLLFRRETFVEQLETALKPSLTEQANRDLVRLLSNDARELKTDKQGRLQLPEYLITFAQLEREVVVVGSYDWIEIWHAPRYHQYLEKIEPQLAQIAARVSTPHEQP